MSEGERDPRPAGSITIDQLLALNEEIAALVRAGVPLERGLVVAGRDLRGRLGRIATALSRGSAGARACPRRWRARSSRSPRFTARSSRRAHGRAVADRARGAGAVRPRLLPRPAPPSGWRSGIPCWC